MNILINRSVSYSEKGAFHVIDPRIKLFFMLAVNVIIIVGNDTISLAVYIGASGLAFLSRMMRTFVFITVMTIFWWCCFVYLFSPLLDNPLDPYGLFSGMVFRGTSIGTITLWFMYSTTTYTLSSSLERMKIPTSITIPFTVTVRFLPTLINEFYLIRDALKLRGVYRSVFDTVRHPIRIYNCFVVPMILRSMRMAEEIAAAAETRGIGSHVKRTFLREPVIGKRDVMFSVLWILYLSATAVFGAV